MASSDYMNSDVNTGFTGYVNEVDAARKRTQTQQPGTMIGDMLQESDPLWGSVPQNPDQTRDGGWAPAVPDQPASPVTTAGYTGTPYTGFERHEDSLLSNAFDLNREQNPYKSAKDAFAYFANEAAKAGNPANLSSMESAEQWFRNYIMPGLEQFGHRVTDVQGDKAYVIAKDGEGWVDFGGRTGDPSADLYWGAEGPSGSGGTSNALSPAMQQAMSALPQVASAVTSAAPAPTTTAMQQASSAAPGTVLDKSWIDVSKEDPAWVQSMREKPSVFWQLVMAAHGGQMSPEQKALVQKNIETGAPIDGSAAPAPGGGGGTGAAQDPKGILMQQLMARMQQGLNVDRNDPVIRTQADSFNAAQNRARRQYQSESAEKLASRGLGDSGALRNEQRLADEQSANAQGAFESELVGRELMARRQEIQHALDSMGNLLTEQERQALQRELAAADNAIKRYGIDTQNKQYFAGLSQQDKHFYDQLSLSERLAMTDDAFRNRQLGQQDTQFRDQMGFNTADRQAYWDAIRRGQLG